jgi:hypothetical protein
LVKSVGFGNLEGFRNLFSRKTELYLPLKIRLRNMSYKKKKIRENPQNQCYPCSNLSTFT